MRRGLLVLLLLGCLLLTGCMHDPVSDMSTDVQGAEIPAPAADEPTLMERTAVLWFRFCEEPYLAAETRRLSYAAEDGDALALLRMLMQGPSAASTELNALFPVGTRVISVHQSGRIMFVTLSRHILNAYADEPDDWRDDPAWAAEVPLRRKLAMQGIAATLTENCDVDEVVILLERPAEVTDSLRLRQSYYTLDGDTALADVLRRDESLLLTPSRTAAVILRYWQEADWVRLHRYLAMRDPATGQPRPEAAAFAAQMAETPHLLDAVADGGSISADGQSALFTLCGTWLTRGTEQTFSGRTLRLVREKGLWRVGLSELTERTVQP